MIDLDALRAFVVFAEYLNFTHAAEKLHISQPALHIKIGKLADLLGVQLYERHGKNLLLTDKGEDTLRFGRQMLEHESQFRETLLHGNAEQTISLAAGEGSYLYLLGPAIREFRKNASANLKLVTAQSADVISRVKNGQVHFGVTAATSYPEELEVTRLLKVPMVLVVPSRHALVKKKTVRINDLEGLDMVVPAPDRPHRQMLDRHSQSAGISWKVAVEANGWELMLHFVKLGLGFAVVNGFCRLPAGFVARPFSDLPGTRYHLLNLPGVHKSGDRKLLYNILRSLPRL